ncbi:hypothetical protein LCGC14_1846330 [marine sediment metagenome]|uniref:Uncharacterized protein n=1 Tax=marine sediment metagenome TaxID=412755 RepID=A0A0F9H007_9ZZZZ
MYINFNMELHVDYTSSCAITQISRVPRER